MSFEFRDAVRSDSLYLILLAGGTGSGKTESAMRLATGLSGGAPFAVIDTENERALLKADDYHFKHASLDEPFEPERYSEAIAAAVAAGFKTIVIDSGSHEWDGIGGVLDMQDAEFARMGRNEAARMTSWVAPKQAHKRFVQNMLRAPAHIIMCLRAEDKIEIVKEPDPRNPQRMQTVVRPKQSPGAAINGWIPICERRLPFEATISLLLLNTQPGVPLEVKLERAHKPLISLTEQLDEDTGRRLAEWAVGGKPRAETANRDEQRAIINAQKEAGISKERAIEIIRELTGATRTADVPVARVGDVIDRIKASAGDPAGTGIGGDQPPGDGPGNDDGSPGPSPAEGTLVA